MTSASTAGSAGLTSASSVASSSRTRASCRPRRVVAVAERVRPHQQHRVRCARARRRSQPRSRRRARPGRAAPSRQVGAYSTTRAPASAARPTARSQQPRAAARGGCRLPASSTSSRGSPVTDDPLGRARRTRCDARRHQRRRDREQPDAAGRRPGTPARARARTSRLFRQNETRSAAGESRCSFLSGMPCQSCTTKPPRVAVAVHVAEAVGDHEHPGAQREPEPAAPELRDPRRARAARAAASSAPRGGQPDQPARRGSSRARASAAAAAARPRRGRCPSRTPRAGRCAAPGTSRARRARRRATGAARGRCRCRR